MKESIDISNGDHFNLGSIGEVFLGTSTPVTIEDSGLSQKLLEDIIARQLLESGLSDLSSLSRLTALSNPILEKVLRFLRDDARLEVRSPEDGSQLLRYGLTEAGRQFAREAFERSSYIGPAPVTAEAYISLVKAQSVRDIKITRAEMKSAYSDVVIKPELLDRLGAAIHSGKAMFIYGPAGTGKTFLCSRLIRLLQSPVYIPHAIVVGDSIVRVFDEALHTQVTNDGSDSAWLNQRPDPRFVLCERPYIVSGGELTMDMLEVRQDNLTKQYVAPLQMKATHGIYMVDDLGRQKMSTDELFNRWIVPMESGIDYLTLDSGARLAMPVDVILIFSTNMLPEDLDDPAFQRRIGHKIGFDYADRDSYHAIWQQECGKRNVQYDPNLVDFVIDDLHVEQNTPMLACHPRDLIGMALDYSRYAENTDRISREGLVLAWDNYFARAVEAADTVQHSV